MKTRLTRVIRQHVAGGALSIAALLLLAASAQAQNLFEADLKSGNIYEFTPNGTRSTFASGLDQPFGLAFDSAGNLFEADLKSGNIYEFTPNGTRSTFASGLDQPFGLAFNSAGNLFVGDNGIGNGYGNIYEFSANGTRSTFASGLSGPLGLAFNSAGDLFEADEGSDNIYEFSANGTRSTFASLLTQPEGLAFDSAGNLYVGVAGSVLGAEGIIEFTPGPVPVESEFAAVPGGESYELAFDSKGNLYQADAANDRINEFTTPNATESLFASGLEYPAGLAFQLVPEPSTWVLVGLGLSALLVSRRWKA
jgi:hypothetical protein